MSADGYLVFLNFRMSDRQHTEQGPRLDRIVGMGAAERNALQSRIGAHAVNGQPLDPMQPGPARFTGIMRSQFAAMFSRIFRLRSADSHRLIRLTIEDVAKTFRVDDAFALFSLSESAAGVEGDDLLFCIILREDSPQHGERILQQRPTNYSEAIMLLQDCLPNLGNDIFEDVTFVGIPGFYLAPLQSTQCSGDNAAASVILSGRMNNAVALVGCYLFYCWLICQRAERLLNSISFEGDKDAESRKFILSRKKIVTSMRFALLKNRAEPDSAILSLYFLLLEKFRLSEQLTNLTSLSEEIQKAITTQDNYLVTKRLRKIELILFLSTILSLGVGLNAISMPPFFDKDATNILSRGNFWIVFLTVFAAAFLIWGWVENWTRIRRSLLRNVSKLRVR